MIEKVIKLSCDWCGCHEETSMKGVGEKRFRKKSESRGWFKVVSGKDGVLDFCCQKCREDHVAEQNYMNSMSFFGKVETN